MPNNSIIEYQIIRPNEYDMWFDRFKAFLDEFLKTCPPTHLENYATQNWENVSASFLKCLYIDRRYDSGCVTVALDQQRIIGLSACYHFRNNTYYLGSRSCVISGYEKLHLISSLLIPLQQNSLPPTADFGLISFNENEYSRRVLNLFKTRERWTAAKAKRLYGLKYWPFHFISDRTFLINACQQYVAYCDFHSIGSEHAFIRQIS